MYLLGINQYPTLQNAGMTCQTISGCSISLWDTAFGANTERFQGLVPLLPHLCPLSVPKGGVCGVYRKALEKGFSEMYWLGGGGGPEPYFFENWLLPLTGWVFFACSGLVSDRLHRTPTPYSNIWAYECQVIRVDLLHLMCRRHVQHGSPQDPNMLKTLTNNFLGHPGDALCNLQHQAHQSARNQR